MEKEKKYPIFFSVIFALVVLWQMLLPGYVLTLDMAFTPHINLNFAEGAFYNALPIRSVLWFLNLFLTGWIVQKVMLVALFICLSYLAVRFLPVPKKHYANYWAALFFALNPFVYERFLAGHLMILFAYACLPPLIHYILEFFKEYSYKKLGWMLFLILLVGMSSLHFLVMAVLIVAVCFVVRFIARLRVKGEPLRLAKYAAILAGLFLVLSSYWIAPYVLNKQTSYLNVFNEANQLAFKTAGANGAETAFNVLTLYGFWGEREPWSRYFLSPRDNIVFWSIILVLLAGVIVYGIYHAFKNRRKEALFFALVGFAAFVLSCGLGEGIFKAFNGWLFEHIGFWRGFRDTQKFSGLLALAYAYFGGWGVFAILERFRGQGKERTGSTFGKILIFLLFCIPVLYTYPMVGGFARQLSPVWYPKSWYEAKEILDSDQSDHKVLFLPWHQYLSLDFNNNIINSNPAVNFFGTRMVAGDNMEMGDVFSQSADKENLAIQSVILDEKMTPDEAIEALKMHKISYIMVMNKVIAQDYLKYAFLGSSLLEKIYGNDDLTVYKIGSKVN